MFVGVLRLVFHIPHARSLKEKRSSVRRLRDRIRARFEVSVAEVASQDLHQRAVLGVAIVSGEQSVCDSVLQQVARFAELAEDAMLVGRETEMIPLGNELYGDEDG